VTDIKIYWNKETNSKNLIGQRVRELRTERQLSQKALAEQLQLAGYEFNDLTVLRIEQGTRFVPDYEVVALAEFFHVSYEYLLGVQDKNKQ
jgi:transcriptional regulator with XRE-family HTH domain